MIFARPTSQASPRRPFALAPGFTLLETIIAAALVTLLTGGVYAVYKPARLAADVSGEVARLSTLRRSIPGGYAAAPDFYGLNNADPAAKATIDPTPWGSMTVHPVDFSSPYDGWGAVYQGVPDDACVMFANRELNARFASVIVDTRTVASIDDVLLNCQGEKGHVVEFRDYPGKRVAAGASALTALNPAPRPVAPPGVAIPPPLAPAPAPAPAPGPGYTTAPVTVVPPPYVAPAPGPGLPYAPAPLPGAPVYPPACVVPSPSTKTQTVSCPAGQTGTITQEQTASCPDPYGAVVWSPWTETGNTCVADPPPSSPPPPAGTAPGSTAIAFAGTMGVDINAVSGATTYEMGLSCNPNDVTQPLAYTTQAVSSSVLHASTNSMDTFGGAQTIGGYYTTDPGEPEVTAMYAALPQSACQPVGQMFPSPIKVFVRACNSAGCSAWSAPVTSFCSWSMC